MLWWARPRVEDWPPRAPAVHPIEQYWVLAFLLHVWVMLTFGTLQGGTAKPGEGVWGSLTVSLVGLPGRGEALTHSIEEGALAPASRFSPGATAHADSGSAQAEPPSPAPADEPAGPPVDVVPPQSETAPSHQPEGLPTTPAPPEALPAQVPAAPALPEPVPVDVPMVAAAPTAQAPVDIEPAASVSPPLNAAAAEALAPTAVLSPTPPALTVARSGSTIATVPAVRPLPDLARLQQRVPASLTPPAPMPEPMASAMAQASTAQPPAVPSPVVPPKPPPIAAAAVVPAAPLTPVPVPVAAPEPMPPAVAMRQLSAEAVPVLSRRSATTEATTPVRPLARLPEVQTLASADRVGAARRPVVQGQPQSTAAMPLAAPASTAGEAPGQVSAAAPAPPTNSAKLILELPRGGAMASQGIKGVLQMLPPPPERKSKLGEAVDKAAKSDCREAYQKNGLLAVVPLVADAVRDKGCQW